MAVISEPERFRNHIMPRHLIAVIVEGHGVGDDLHSVVKRAVRLYVDLLVKRIPDVKDLVRLFAVLSAAVNFKLNAEEARTFSVENGCGLVGIVVDRGAFVFLETIRKI